MDSKILKQIKSLPPLPKSVLEVQRITNDPNSSIADLVKVIKEDSMLTSGLLKAANSPLYGFTRQIKTVDQAVSLFGMTTVKGFVISFAVRNTMKFDLSAYGVDENHFHDVSTKRNALAINWYRSKKDKLDILGTDSFLIDLGAVIISLLLKTEGKNEEFKSRLTKENRYELEKEFIGANTPEITAEIFKYWHFPDDLTIPMQNLLNPENADNFQECSKALHVISVAFNLLGSDENDIKNAAQKVEDFGLDLNLFTKALEKMEIKI